MGAWQVIGTAAAWFGLILGLIFWAKAKPSKPHGSGPDISAGKPVAPVGPRPNRSATAVLDLPDTLED